MGRFFDSHDPHANRAAAIEYAAKIGTTKIFHDEAGRYAVDADAEEIDAYMETLSPGGERWVWSSADLEA